MALSRHPPLLYLRVCRRPGTRLLSLRPSAAFLGPGWVPTSGLLLRTLGGRCLLAREQRRAYGESSAASHAGGGGGGGAESPVGHRRRDSLALQDIRRLLALAHPERRRLAAAVGFLTVSSVITMSAPFFLGKVIDVIYTGSAGDVTANLTSLCALLSGVFLCGAAANATRVYLMQTSGQRIVQRLRASLFSSVLKQEVGFFDKTPTGELVNRLSSDTALLGRSVTENLSDGLRALAQASAGIGMMTNLGKGNWLLFTRFVSN